MRVVGDTTIEAVYVDAGEEVTPQAAMLCSVSYNKSTQTIKYTAKRSVPEGCKIVKHGMILTSKPAWEALYKDNQEAFKLEADRIITKVATTTGLAGNYSVSVKCTKPNIWYAKGYVVYLHFKVKEASVRARYGTDNGSVWTDSCVEFFTDKNSENRLYIVML